MLPLVLILVGVALVLYLTTYISRKKSGHVAEVVINENPECCGVHDSCDMDSLQIVDTKIEYFDDEELDSLSGLDPNTLSDEQVDSISDVFYSMKESDIASWLKSLQLRSIQLPESIREEALMIVSERRA